MLFSSFYGYSSLEFGRKIVFIRTISWGKIFYPCVIFLFFLNPFGLFDESTVIGSSSYLRACAECRIGREHLPRGFRIDSQGLDLFLFIPR